MVLWGTATKIVTWRHHIDTNTPPLLHRCVVASNFVDHFALGLVDLILAPQREEQRVGLWSVMTTNIFNSDEMRRRWSSKVRKVSSESQRWWGDNRVTVVWRWGLNEEKASTHKSKTVWRWGLPTSFFVGKLPTVKVVGNLTRLTREKLPRSGWECFADGRNFNS